MQCFVCAGLSFLSLFSSSRFFIIARILKERYFRKKVNNTILFFLASYFCGLCILCVVILCGLLLPYFCVLLRHMAKIICISCRKYCIRNALNSGKVRKYNKLNLKVSQIKIFRFPRNIIKLTQINFFLCQIRKKYVFKG